MSGVESAMSMEGAGMNNEAWKGNGTGSKLKCFVPKVGRGSFGGCMVNLNWRRAVLVF